MDFIPRQRQESFLEKYSANDLAEIAMIGSKASNIEMQMFIIEMNVIKYKEILSSKDEKFAHIDEKQRMYIAMLLRDAEKELERITNYSNPTDKHSE